MENETEEKELTATQITNANLVSPALRELYMNRRINIEQYEKVLEKAYQIDFILSTDGLNAFIQENL